MNDVIYSVSQETVLARNISQAQQLWDSILDFTGEIFLKKLVNSLKITDLEFIPGDDYFKLLFFCIVFYNSLLYWTIGGFLSLLYVLEPSFIQKYKIQPNATEKFDWKKFSNLILLNLFNQFAVGSFGAFVSFQVLKLVGLTDVRELPTIFKVLLDLFVFYLVWEIFFYYTHRILHTKYFYKSIHKIHHQYRAPLAIVTQYSHPVEHLFSNLSPSLIGWAIMKTHILTIYLWTSLICLDSMRNHCGYDFPFLPSNEMHDYHHSK